MRGFLSIILAIGLTISPVALHAEEAAPNVDAAFDKLVQLDPEALVAHLATLKAEAAERMERVQALRVEADGIATEAASLAAQLDTLTAQVKALLGPLGLDMPAPEVAMAAADEPMASEGPTVTFDDHIRPIFQQHCMSCHNIDMARGGLELDTLEALLVGGSSGEVIAKGDPGGSRLLRLVEGAEEPVMPPSGDGLNDEELALLREWIRLGAPKDKNSKVAMAEEAGFEEDGLYIDARFRPGPPPMPAVALSEPAQRTARPITARALATSPIAPLLAVGGDRQLLLYNLEDGALLGALPFPEGDIYTLSFSVNGELIIAGGGEPGASGLAVLWDVRTGERIGEYGQGYDTVLAADISPNHRFVAVGGPNRRVRVYNQQNGEALLTLERHTDWIHSVKYSLDGELLATADRAGNLNLWQAANGRHVTDLRGHDSAIHDMAFSRDSAVLASAGADGSIQLWDTWEYRRIRSIDAHRGPALSVDFSDDNQLVSTGRDRRAKRWALDGTEMNEYPRLPDWGYQARFGNDDSIIIAGTWNGVVASFNAESAEPMSEFSTVPASSK